MKTFNNIFIIIILFLHVNVHGQSTTNEPVVVPPSPEAAALMEYVNIPVDHYTGVPKIDVPIFNLQSRKLSVPISLNYHASGIKVHEVASTVGLGWRLEAGGAITRVMMGLPDEEGYCSPDNHDGENANGQFFSEESVDQYYRYIVYGLSDGQPDIFYYNFLGRSGRFVLDKNGTPVIIPFEDIKISQTICANGPNEFVITDESGIVYYFGGGEAFVENTHNKSYSMIKNHLDEEIIDPLSIKEFEFTSTWYLKKIEAPGGTDLIEFTYEAGNEIVDKTSSYIKLDIIYPDHALCPENNTQDDDLYKYENLKTISDPKYISGISTILGEAKFGYHGFRKDLSNGRALNTIEIDDFNRENIVNFRLVQGYFGCAIVDRGGRVFNLEPQDCGEMESRLRLDKVVKYKDSETVIIREFKYNETDWLPPRNDSYFTDHWGYYNNHFGSLIDFNEDGIEDGYQDNGYHYPMLLDIEGYNLGLGAYKGPSWRGTEACVLEEIYYPTGGKTKFDYILKRGGGLAVHLVEDFENSEATEATNHKRYSYFDEFTYGEPKYYYDYVNSGTRAIFQQEAIATFLRKYVGIETFGSSNVLIADFTTESIESIIGDYIMNLFFSAFEASVGSCFSHVIVRKSESLISLYDLGGISSGYSRVNEHYQDGSVVKYEFTNFDEYPDTEPNRHDRLYDKDNSPAIIVLPPDKQTLPFSPKTFKGWHRGLLRTQKTFDSDDVLLEELNNEYYHDFPYRSSTKGVVASANVVFYIVDKDNPLAVVQNPFMHIASYDLISQPIRIKSTESKSYALGSDSDALSIRKEFQYNSDHLQLFRTTTTSNESDEVLHELNLWSTNFDTEVDGPQFLKDQHVHNALIEEIVYKKIDGKYYVISGLLNEYSGFDLINIRTLNLALPLDIDNFKISGAFDLVTMPANSYINFYVPDERYNNPENLTMSFEYDGYGNISRIVKPGNRITEFEWGPEYNYSLLTRKIENASNPQITSFTYKPLIGLYTQTDPNGKVVRYEYDGLGRLKAVIDFEGNTLSKYRYQYRVE
jgi:YD repeat-containing protein